MPVCTVCWTTLPDEARSCSLCGTSVPEPSSDGGTPPEGILPTLALFGDRVCPACHKQYDGTYADGYCECGTALVPDDIELQLLPFPAPMAEAPTGPRIVVYSADREPVFTFPLNRDVTRIGRTDAVRGEFVDLDLARIFDADTARKVSRKHAVILRSRETQTFVLRPLANNTGTQIGNELVADLVDYPLSEGTRIVLGGAVRLKFHAGS